MDAGNESLNCYLLSLHGKDREYLERQNDHRRSYRVFYYLLSFIERTKMGCIVWSAVGFWSLCLKTSTVLFPIEKGGSSSILILKSCRTCMSAAEIRLKPSKTTKAIRNAVARASTCHLNRSLSPPEGHCKSSALRKCCQVASYVVALSRQKCGIGMYGLYSLAQSRSSGAPDPGEGYDCDIIPLVNSSDLL